MGCLSSGRRGASGKESQAACYTGRSEGRTSGPKRPVERKVRGGGSASADAGSVEAPENDLVASLQCPGPQSCPLYKPLHSPAAEAAAVPSGLARVLTTPSLPPAERLPSLSRETPSPPVQNLVSLAHFVSRDLLTLFSRESNSVKTASKRRFPKPATPLPAPSLEVPPSAPPSSRSPLRRAPAPAPASSWSWTREPEGRARAPSALLRARCHLGREWGRARAGPGAGGP